MLRTGTIATLVAIIRMQGLELPRVLAFVPLVRLAPIFFQPTKETTSGWGLAPPSVPVSGKAFLGHPAYTASVKVSASAPLRA